MTENSCLLTKLDYPALGRRASGEGTQKLKALYVEAPLGGSHPYSTNFHQNGAPFIYLEQNYTLFLYLKDKPKQ